MNVKLNLDAKKTQILNEIELLENTKITLLEKSKCITLYDLKSIIDPLRNEISMLRNIVYLLDDLNEVQ